MLFSLLASSSYVAEQNSNALFQELRTKKFEASIFRLKEPEPVCFMLDDNDLSNYPFLSKMIRDADEYTEQEIASPSPLIDNNRYIGLTANPNASDVLVLVKQYAEQLNHTESTDNIAGFEDERHSYSCNIGYNNKQYFLQLDFKSLTAINERRGFISISIGPSMDKTSNFTTYYSFNNTAVWTDSLDSAAMVTLQTELDGTAETVSTTILPGSSWDYRLDPDYSKPQDTIYRYTIDSGKTHASGDIVVKYYPQCMNQQVADSLYSQSHIDMKFPTYLPDGYRYICGIHFYGDVIIQAYWNRTVQDPLSEQYRESDGDVYDFPNYAFGQDALDSGVVQIIAGKVASGFTSFTNAQDRFDDIRSERAYLDAQLIEVFNIHDGKRYGGVAYRHNVYAEKDINIVELFDKENGEFYFLRGKMPLRELVVMAESLKA